MNLKTYCKAEQEAYHEARVVNARAQSYYDNMSISSKKGVSQKCIDTLRASDEQLAAAKENYAKKIFDKLSVKQPDLIRRRENITVSWKEAFGSDYAALSPELKSSLIALVEEKGGQYRLK